MKHFSCLDTNTTNKRECNQLSHESVDVGSLCKRLLCFLCKDGLLLVLSIIKGEFDNAHYSHAMCTTIREPLPALQWRTQGGGGAQGAQAPPSASS